MGKEIIDRRVTQRIPFETEVNIQFSDGKPSIKATVTNISVGGMHFVLPKGAVKLPPEEVVTLNFQLPDQTPVSIRGEVCRFSNSLDHNRKPIVCYAVKFQEVSQYIWSYIYEFCQMRFGGEGLDRSQRLVVAPEPLQQLNQGTAPVRKTDEPSLPPTEPTLMEWTLRDGQGGKPSGEEASAGSFITPPDEPLMNWIFNDKFPGQKTSDISSSEDDSVVAPQADKTGESEPVNGKTETATESQNIGSREPIPIVEKLIEEKPSPENQKPTINALEESMAELLKQMDSSSAAKEAASATLENPIPRESAASDSSVSENTIDSPPANQPTVIPPSPLNAADKEPENTPDPEPIDVEQPPLKRSLFSWSRKTPAPQVNYEKERLSENNGLSLDQPKPANPLNQDNLPTLEFDVNFSQKSIPIGSAAEPIPDTVKEQEAPAMPEKSVEQVESHAAPLEITPVQAPSFHPDPSFGGTDSSMPLPPKEPEKPPVSEEIDISFMNRNSSMISLDQQMIDRIIHAMRTNSKKDPNSK